MIYMFENGFTMIRIIIVTLLPFIYCNQKDTSLPRTVDQCYGQPIPVACDPGHMVKVNNAFYRQTENCRGGYRSNYCSKEEPSNPACVGNQTCVFTTPWIYLTSECGYSNNFLVSYQCVPKSIQHNICQEKEIYSSSGYIVSPNYPKKYPKSRQCHSKVKVRPGQRIRVYLLDLYLAYYNYDVDKQCVDALWIVDGKERTDYLCSGRQRGLIFTSQSNEITVFFTSEGHEYLNAKGFWIFFEGVAASKVQQGRVTHVKKPPTRGSGTSGKKLLSHLPIQVTPTDSSIVPPAGVELKVTVPPRSFTKVNVQGQSQGHSLISQGYRIGAGHQNLRQTSLAQQNGGGVNYKQGQEGVPLRNTRLNRQRQGQAQLNSQSKTYPKLHRNNQGQHRNEYTQYNREHQSQEGQVVRDKSRETLSNRRYVQPPVTVPTSTSASRRYISTKMPYIPTDTPTARTMQILQDSDIMQINMYNSLDEDDELFNLLARSGELVKGIKTNRDIPSVNKQVKLMESQQQTEDEVMDSPVFRQAPLITQRPRTQEPVTRYSPTTPSTVSLHEEGTPAPTQLPETPVGEVNKTIEILPWNSAYASQVKGIREKEEGATGGIVGGAAGCILLVLAFVVLAVFWRRRHPHEKGGFPFSRKSSSYNDIIMAYAPSEAGSTIGGPNFGFDECPPPAALKEFPLDSCVANPNYVSPMQSWRNLLPIDEVPEIIYAQHKGGRPGQPPPKPNRSMLWMRSKSLDDLCAKIGSKVTRRKKKPPDPPIQESQSLDCLKRAYENVILPANFNSMVIDEPPIPMQRRASLSDLHPLDPFSPPPMSPMSPMSPMMPMSPVSSMGYDLHLQAMQQHMHQQQLQQQLYLQQQEAVFQQQQQLQDQLFAGPVTSGRPGYESLCLDGAATAPAHTAALQPQDTRLLARYETMALHKTPAADEVAL